MQAGRPGIPRHLGSAARADGIRTGSVTAPKFHSRGSSFAVRVALLYPINTTNLGRVCPSGEAFGFASTVPENLRPSTRHRDLHRPIHTDISTTITQHIDTTTRLHNDTITKPHNWKSEGHEF